MPHPVVAGLLKFIAYKHGLHNVPLLIAKPTSQNFTFHHSLYNLVSFSHFIAKPINKNCIFIHQLAGPDPVHTIVNSICDSLRKGLNWVALSKKYDSLNLSDYVIENVLLRLKEPTEAKRALGFFHWVAHSKGMGHGVKVYCITVHILVRARLANDARGLMESILLRNVQEEGDSVVDVLLGTYRITDSCPFVFDLLVQCYSKLGMFETGFDVLCYLDEKGFSLTLGSYNTLLYGIRKSGDGNPLIWKVYGHMIQKRLSPNKLTSRVMIDALCKAGELQNYVDIVDRIHGKRCSPVVIVSTSLVYRMLSEGQIEEALLLLKRMLQKNMIVDTISYSMIVYAKLKSGGLDVAREMYGEMLSRGFCPNSFVYTLFIEAYCKEGTVDEALKLMEELVNNGLRPYDETYNFLIMGCAKTGKLINSISFCEEMTKKGFLPTSSAFNEMVGRLCESGNMRKANDMLTVIIEKGFLPDETTYCILIDGYQRERNISEVLKLYYEMEFRSMSPGLLTFTLLIRTLCEHKKLEEAEKYLAVMKSRLLYPSVDIYEVLMSAHLENGNKERVHELCNEMLQKGLKFDQSVIRDLSSEIDR